MFCFRFSCTLRSLIQPLSRRRLPIKLLKQLFSKTRLLFQTTECRTCKTYSSNRSLDTSQ